MRSIVRSAIVLCCAIAGLQTVPARAEKRVALVIGNASYSRIAGLANVGNDAAAVATLLRAAKFDSVDVKANLGVAELRRALREFAGRAADADVAVVYYAGHGIEVDRTNYLIPVDARLATDFDVEDETVSLDRVLQALEPAKRLRLVILDACRENPFLKSMKRSGATRSVGRGLSRIEPRTTNTLVAFAAKEGAVADDGRGPNSPFTAALVRHLVTPGLDLRIAFGRVRDDVLKSTSNRQEPHLYGSAGGDIMSIAGPASAAAPPPVVRPPSEAAETARICREVEGMSNLATLAVLDRQHKGRPAGECVAARIDELKKLAMAVPAPAPVAPPARPPAAVPRPAPAVPPAFVPYHTRPVSLVVPYAAGGLTDVMARIVGEHMSRTLGQPAVVINQPGASGAIATRNAAKAAADGHTVLVHGEGIVQSLAAMGAGAGAATFEPAGLIHVTPMVIVARKDAPANFLQWMKDPSRTFATAGIGSASHLCALHIAKTLGATFVAVPFKGYAEVRNALQHGHVDMACEGPIPARDSMASGAVRAFAVLAGRRVDAIPDVPTAGEIGVPGLEFAVYAGLYAPKGTPRAAVVALNAALQKALADTSVVGRLSTMVVPPEPHMRSPEAHARYFMQDFERSTQLMKGAGLAR